MGKLSDLIPGGCATYSKGDDCFAFNAPEYLVKGEGCYVWDNKGNKYIDFGMGLRSVILGHAYPKVNEAVIEAIDKGTNFTRPCLLEKELAELMLELFPWHDMVKFGKSGSDVTSAAIKLARAYTGRKTILIAKQNPFISQHDWFIGTTSKNGGIIPSPYVFWYDFNNLNEIKSFVEKQLKLDIAAIVLDPSTVDITNESLQYLRKICDDYGIVFILDEVISGFRYSLRGIQGIFGVYPDLCTFGKSMGNGFSVSALMGKREIMQLGDSNYGNVFLLSGTHNAETSGLAAAIATITELKNKPAIFYNINMTGKLLVKGLIKKIEGYELEKVLKPKCFAINKQLIGSNPSISFSSFEAKTIFDQHMIECNILMPYIAPSYSHEASEIDNTLCAAEYALRGLSNAVKRKNLKASCFKQWVEKPVFT
jgi:glutamate-1-semialdehyde 2,1-aminomutase